MKIGIDGRELLGQSTGAGRYLSSLCREWAALPAAAEHELLIYAPARLESTSPSTPPRLTARA